MALIAVSGQPGCRFEEVARISAQRLGFELITESRLANLIEQELGAETVIPDRAHTPLMESIVAHLATEHHLVVCAEGADAISASFPGRLRAYVVAPDSVRVGNLMLDRRLERPAARKLLQEMEAAQKAARRRMLGRASTPAAGFDLILNAELLESEQMAGLIEHAVQSLGLPEHGFLSAAAEAQMQFRLRLRLARHGVSPPGHVKLPGRAFAHQSEEIFANLLDFYRIAWDYEPRSFPIQWDRDGKVSEAFTPDFYLPEFDLYVELTTMKQSLVTKKNRKIRLLRQLYPHINIQVFYQKDIENLIFKYGLAERTVKV
ncbi:MAG TPA: cytidylate kinase family protein [Bryobacteraceae bacterium]|nr:cytidylate kinase family protein [Bryobacteraceae bacterium]